MLASACGLELDNQGIDPAGTTPGVVVEQDGQSIWRVKIDNPPIGSLFTLYDQMYAERSDWAWEYYQFDLELEVNDAVGQYRLLTWPEQSGFYGNDEDKFFFEGHGIKLAPGIEGDPLATASTARAYYTWYGAELLFEDPLGLSEGRFELDPAVALVPLHVVVLHGEGLEDGLFVGSDLDPQWISENDTTALFDDEWVADEYPSPDSVVSEWRIRPGTGYVAGFPAPGSGRWFQPDRIFEQCDVQFRQVSYHSCAAPPEILYDSECNGEIGSTGHVNTVNIHVDNECGVPNDGIPRVIFVGSLGGNNCVPGVVQGAHKDDNVFITNMFADQNTLAHELGHILGLFHTDAPGNLMQEAGVDTDLIEDGQCQTVHDKAEAYQQKYWEEKFEIEGPYWDKAPMSQAQQNARKLVEMLREDQYKTIGAMIGEAELAKVIEIIRGDSEDWPNDVATIVEIVGPYAEELQGMLTEEQLELFPKL